MAMFELYTVQCTVTAKCDKICKMLKLVMGPWDISPDWHSEKMQHSLIEWILWNCFHCDISRPEKDWGRSRYQDKFALLQCITVTLYFGQSNVEWTSVLNSVLLYRIAEVYYCLCVACSWTLVLLERSWKCRLLSWTKDWLPTICILHNRMSSELLSSVPLPVCSV